MTYQPLIAEKVFSPAWTQFSKPRFSEKVHAKVFDIYHGSESDPFVSQERECFNQTDLEAVIPPTCNGTRIKIISLHSLGAPLPVLITDQLLWKIRSYYDLKGELSHVVSALGNTPLASGGGNSNFFTCKEQDGSSEHCCYRSQYVEKNSRSRGNPWSLRHTSVYHLHQANFDFFLFVHPTNDSLFEQQLVKMTKGEPSLKELLGQIIEDPFQLHMMLLTTYLENWSDLLKEFDKNISNKNDQILALDIEDLQSRPVSDDFTDLHSLRDLNNRISHAQALCNGNVPLVGRLFWLAQNSMQPRGALSNLQHRSSFFASLSERLQGYAKGFDVLQASCNACINLSSHTMDWKYQNSAETTNKILLNLSRQTAEDSAIVKTITILSLFYLPGSFMAVRCMLSLFPSFPPLRSSSSYPEQTLYGANFFAFDTASNSLILGGNFWILLVSWLILSALTMGVFALILKRNRQKAKCTPGDVEGGGCEKVKRTGSWWRGRR